MKRVIWLLGVVFALVLFVGCGNDVAGQKVQASKIQEKKNMTSENIKYATRKLDKGTKVNLIVGKTTIPAMLNDCKSAKELIARLPCTVKMHKYSHDYCGVMENPLSYDKNDVHNGWQNGDIDFATDGNYFTILYKDEDVSKQFGFQVNMGIIKAPLSVMDTLPQDIEMRIELAK